MTKFYRHCSIAMKQQIKTAAFAHLMHTEESGQPVSLEVANCPKSLVWQHKLKNNQLRPRGVEQFL